MGRSENADMSILNLPAYPRHEWPDLLLDVMHTPGGDEGGALFDAIEADNSLLAKRGRRGAAVQNHLLLSKRQLRSGAMWRGFTVGYVLMLTLARAEAGEKRKGFKLNAAGGKHGAVGHRLGEVLAYLKSREAARDDLKDSAA